MAKVSKTTVKKIFRQFTNNEDRADALVETFGISYSEAYGLVARHRSVAQRIEIVTKFLKTWL